MEEHFWEKYRTEHGLQDFEVESDSCNRSLSGKNLGDDKYLLSCTQKGIVTKILFDKNGVCYLNGKYTGKKCWVSDIAFSMTYDMFGGLILVFTDGDYLTVRMDGKITSFMNIPFEKLDAEENEFVRKIVSEYTGKWTDHI